MDERILRIDGWMADTELLWLHDTARRVPPGELIVEIGSWMGRSSSAIYTGAAGKNPVVCIDTWEGSPDEPEHDIAQSEDIHSIFRGNMQSLEVDLQQFVKYDALENSPYCLIGDSLEVVSRLPDGCISWLFYDGRHTTTGENLDAWLPKMKPDGLLTGHDYFCFYEDIQQEIHKRFYIHRLHHSIWMRYMSPSGVRWL